MNLKKQVKELQRDNKVKDLEIENFKKKIKSTKINELNVEIVNLTEEYKKIKTSYEIFMKTSLEKERFVKDYYVLQEISGKQQQQLMFLSESNKKTEEDNVTLKEEIVKLEAMIKDKNTKGKKLFKDFNIQRQMIEKMEKDLALLQEIPPLKEKIALYEKKISELNTSLKLCKSDLE